jgi:hypothetical protein
MRTLRDAVRAQDDEQLPVTVGTFLRGLSLGALVGAAIAGSALLQRRLARREPTSPNDRARPRSDEVR